MCRLLVVEYGRTLMAALGCQPNGPDEALDFDIINTAFANMDQEIRTQMQLESNMHLKTRGRLPLEQTAALTSWIGITKKAENVVQNTMAIIRRPTMSHMNLKIPFIILFQPIMGLTS